MYSNKSFCFNPVIKMPLLLITDAKLLIISVLSIVYVYM